ncbi:probable leucine-rich repeat receptor-like protein kinase At5g49770 isoform X2 [Abrus precatorius]|uniref:non-specific serine/threonine protein kinase n=1 Tax=Abrus precatorius TaxID=3816 RepID=A0A8B8JUQ7_ABRPR|nr:probable leucine-rich repeat receptor-like protein kinase At5g49770 isoform X2 [Abrus precatorius]
MNQRHKMILLLLFLFQFLLVAAQTDSRDYAGLTSLTQSWTNKPASWVGTDPCGSSWDGIRCTNSRITQLKLPGLNLGGQLSSAIQSLTELDTVDLSYNTGLTGTIPQEIGNLKKLKSLALVGCGFNGPIPDSIGSLKQLNFLALNSNKFSGNIPRAFGNLSNINWLDLAENQLEGPIPVSDNQGRLGLDLLLNAQHFHMGTNKLSGQIPAKLFNSNMKLEHALFDDNQLEGSIPSTITLVSTLEVVRFDRNNYLAHNNLNGSLPDLSGMNSLTYVDLSNNSFSSSTIPSWVSSLPVLTTAILGDNQLSGTLNLSNGYSDSLQLINLEDNQITNLQPSNKIPNFQLILANNPICLESGASQISYCQVPQTIPSYSTPTNNCAPPSCSSNQIFSPNCKCAFPYTGVLSSRALSFSNYSNTSYYKDLEQTLLNAFRAQHIPVDSVSLSNPFRNSTSDNFQLTLDVFPAQSDRFNATGVLSIAFMLSNQIYKPPEFFSPYVFRGNNYEFYGGESKGSKSSGTGVIVGAVIAALVFIVLALFAGIYAIRQKRIAKRSAELNPFVNWEQNKNSGTAPQLKGSRWFSFDDLKKYTNNFSEANTIGSGGYGKVYQGVLPSGDLVAIKRAAQESMQGAVEFKTEIELLSRVHHKNLVGLVGFCFEKGEQMLVYEYIPNGTVMDSLSGKSGIWMDWVRRLKVALGAARGLAYLHELANPPIIHRDIKSSNILLDNHLNAKVADFGLSKLLVDSERGHVTTQVKGTMGYLDPEYYMTQQLTEKSDVYSFGVLMLELITARRPIEQGKYIVREIRRVMDTSKDLYNLHSILDPTVIKQTRPKGLEKFVILAMRCVKEYASERPTMAEVVKEIENIIELVGLNPNAESASASETYEEVSGGNVKHPYGDEDFSYSGIFPSTKVEPQ